MKLLEETLNSIGNLDKKAMFEAEERVNKLFKPAGSLGKLETIAIQLAGITGHVNNSLSKKVIIVMTADNGVTEEGISVIRVETTDSITKTILRGGAGVGVLGRHAGSELMVVDIGINIDTAFPGMINKKVRYGTGNIMKGPAMTEEEAIKAIETGIEIASEAAENGFQLIGTGEAGIGNTTTSSAILSVYADCEIEEVVGRGAGLSDEGVKNKTEVIKKAIGLNRPDPSDPIDVLSKVGGLDIAGLVGCYLGCASLRLPVVIDGFISGVAALLAIKLNEKSRNFMFPSHVSAERGGRKLMECLSMEPMVYMDMRLGEGTGCALAFFIIEGAAKIINEMFTFKEAVGRDQI